MGGSHGHGNDGDNGGFNDNGNAGDGNNGGGFSSGFGSHNPNALQEARALQEAQAYYRGLQPSEPEPGVSMLTSSAWARQSEPPAPPQNVCTPITYAEVRSYDPMEAAMMRHNQEVMAKTESMIGAMDAVPGVVLGFIELFKANRRK